MADGLINMDICSAIASCLIENHKQVMTEPIDGHILDLYAVFVDSNDSFNDLMENFKQFFKHLFYISVIAPGSLTISQDGMDDSRITDINVYLLRLLYKQIGGERNVCYETQFNKQNKSSNDMIEEDDLDEAITMVNDTETSFTSTTDKNDPEASNLDRLNSLIDFESSAKELTYENSQLPKYLMHRLQDLLNSQPMSYKLGKERACLTEVVMPYVPACHSIKHSMALAQAAYITNNKVSSVQISKLTTFEKEIPDLMDCLNTHMHYIPNIKPQTDLALGDCSYLDTCHKLNSCRYLHYVQYIPDSLMLQVQQDTERINVEQKTHVPLYTHGSCSSTMVKEVLPPQWIRCDVRKFDFSILGKFSVVVADPAWNIHMNLPYGTCNDIELLELPLDELQDEGVLFLWVTGRAIELGKESLTKWGYKVINEVSWIKTNQLGRTIVTGRTGHWLNHSKEHLLGGLKGKPTWLNKHIDLDIIVSTTRETSRKPDELYGMIERMVGKHARKLEIFGRDHNIRAGWFTIGNQLTGSCIHELDIKAKYEATPQFHRNSDMRHVNENIHSRSKNNNKNNNSNTNNYMDNNHRPNSSRSNSKRGRSTDHRSGNNNNNNSSHGNNHKSHYIKQREQRP